MGKKVRDLYSSVVAGNEGITERNVKNLFIKIWSALNIQNHLLKSL